MEDIKYQLFSTPILRVLDFLMEYSDLEPSDGEITAQIKGVRRAAVHQALTRLAHLGIVRRMRRGRRCFNALDFGHAWLTPLKAAGNLLALSPLVDALKECSSRIVLFGSRADGTNRHDSDFDLAVVSNERDSVHRIVAASELADRIQLIVKTPAEMLDFESHEPVFAANIRKGIVLWER